MTELRKMNYHLTEKQRKELQPYQLHLDPLIREGNKEAVAHWLKKSCSWTLGEWIANFRPRIVVWRWERIEIPNSFLHQLQDHGFLLESIGPSPAPEWGREEIFRYWLGWLEKNRERSEIWMVFFHGSGKRYFEDVLDLPFQTIGMHGWRTTEGSLFGIRFENHDISRMVTNKENNFGLFSFINKFLAQQQAPVMVCQDPRVRLPLRMWVFGSSPSGRAYFKERWGKDVGFFPDKGPEEENVIRAYQQKLKQEAGTRWDFHMYHEVCYRGIIKRCQERKIPFFGIFHEDIVFFKGYRKKLASLWEKHREGDWDILIIHENFHGLWDAAVINHTAYATFLHHPYGSPILREKLRVITYQDETILQGILPGNTSFPEFLSLYNRKASTTSPDVHPRDPSDENLILYVAPDKKKTHTIPKKMYILSPVLNESTAPSCPGFEVILVDRPALYKFPEFPGWQKILQNQDEAFKILPLLLLFHFGGIVVCSSDPAVATAAATAASIQEIGVRIFFDKQTRVPLVMRGIARTPWIAHCLRLFFSCCHIVQPTKHLTLLCARFLARTTSEDGIQIEAMADPKALERSRFPYVFPRKLATIHQIDICMLVRDSGEYLQTFFWPMMIKIKAQRPTLRFRLFFYENNSLDHTVQSILAHAHLFEIILFRQDLSRFLAVDRIYRLGKIRNFFIKKLREYYRLRDDVPEKPYVIFIDTDVIFTWSTLEEMIFQLIINPDAVMIGANVAATDGIYYDMLAFDYGRFYMGGGRSEFRSLYSKTKGDLFAAQTCFGGIVLFYRELLFFCRFGDTAETLAGISPDVRCEHFRFCKEIRRWGNIYVAKKAQGFWICNWQREKTTLFLTLEKNQFLA